MSGERFSLDTNILVYAVDNTAGWKQAAAAEIVDRAVDGNCHLTLQALGEFYAVATRKNLMPRAEAAAQVEDWLTLFPTAASSTEAVRVALARAGSGQASFWDALLVATAGEAGCAIILSEDMGHGQKIDEVLILNPFGDGGVGAEAAALLA